MAALSTCAAPPSASGTSPTTSPGPCSGPAGSDPGWSLDREEHWWITSPSVTALVNRMERNELPRQQRHTGYGRVLLRRQEWTHDPAEQVA